MIDPTAKITVDEAFPTRSNMPPRVAFWAIPASSSDDIVLRSRMSMRLSGLDPAFSDGKLRERNHPIGVVWLWEQTL
jgi:hypothetical protein